MDEKKICVVYSEKKKRFYFLHFKQFPGGRRVYYFTDFEDGAIPLPEHLEVVISPTSGHPFVRRKKK